MKVPRTQRSEFKPTPVVYEDPSEDRSKVTNDSLHYVRLENLNKRTLEIGARLRLMQMDQNGELSGRKIYKGFAKYLEGELNQQIVKPQPRNP